MKRSDTRRGIPEKVVSKKRKRIYPYKNRTPHRERNPWEREK